MKKENLYYLTPVLLGIFLFSSDFLSPKLFTGEILNFAVWFILSIFAFSCGWIINKTLGWTHGGKLVFAVTVATSAMSAFLVSFFSGYFGINDLLAENLILYTLRNVMLGAIALFGMAVAELLVTQRELRAIKSHKEMNMKFADDAKRETETIIREANSKAKEILLQAEKEANDLINRKNQIERQLKEFIRTEKELIKQYEAEENQ